MVEATSHFRGLQHSTNAVPSFEIALTVLHLFAENAFATVAFTLTPATPMRSDGSIFLHESNVAISYFLKKQYQSRWCTNDASACQHLLVHFESPLQFDKTPQMPLTHCGDDVSTTFAKGAIEYIAVDLIAHGNKDFLTGARIAVPETPHVTRLTNARYGSRCVGNYALPK